MEFIAHDSYRIFIKKDVKKNILIEINHNLYNFFLIIC